MPLKKSKSQQKMSPKKEEFRGAVGMFCPKCGSLLIPKNDGGKRILACKCGFSTHDTKEAKLKEVLEEKKNIEVIEKEHEPHPLTPANCPKCKHKMAYYWTVQTRAADEPETKFLKCEKCEHVWRDYT